MIVACVDLHDILSCNEHHAFAVIPAEKSFIDDSVMRIKQEEEAPQAPTPGMSSVASVSSLRFCQY